MPGVWDAAFETFGIDSGSNLGSFAWGFPTWLLSGNIPTVSASPIDEAPLPLGDPEVVVVEEERDGVPGLYICPDGRVVGELWACALPAPPRPPIDVPVAPTGTQPVFQAPETYGDEVVVIPPELDPQGTVHESNEQGDAEVAIDWGDIIGGAAVDIIQDWTGGGTPTFVPPTFAGPSSGAPVINPTVQINPATGKPVCKRRRRRRLLTESDFNDLMRISTLPNKQNVAVALAKAVGRR